MLLSRNHILNLTTTLFFIVYIFKQTLEFGAMQVELNIALFIIGILSMAINFSIYSFLKITPSIKKHVLFVYTTVLIMLALFKNTMEVLEFLFKFLYISHFVFIFLKYKDSRLLIFIADIVFILTLLVVALSKFEVLDSLSVGYDLWVKDFGGFNNPNTAPYFIFSSLLTYFVLGKFNRYYLTLVTMLSLFLFFNIYSRTFFYGVVLLFAFQLLSSNHRFSIFFLRYSAGVYLLIVTVAVFFLLLSLFTPQHLDFLMNSSINYLLSNRIDQILSGVHMVDNGTISGINFIALDNIYYELLFVFGPFVLWSYCVNFLRLWRKAMCDRNKKSFLFRFCIAVVLVSFIGLFEGSFTKISSLTILLFILILVDRHSREGRDFFNQR